MLIIIPLHCYLLWVGMHTVTLTYSPLLGGCYVYDGCVNLLHTQVGVNCGYIRCELWLYLISFLGKSFT